VKPLVGMRLSGGRAIVWRRVREGEPVARALLCRGLPRGVKDGGMLAGDVYAAEEIADAVLELEGGEWYTTGGILTTWARRGRWGLIDGVPFDRAQIRAALREWPVTGTGSRWACASAPEGTVLVMCGVRAARVLVMSGSGAAMTGVAGPALVGGVRA
jgi:hypothetical protein